MALPPATPALGAGTQPAGTSAAGYGVAPQQIVGPSPVVFPDPQTGLSDTGRLIDVATGEFLFTTAGLAQGCSTVYQLIVLAAADLDFSELDVDSPDARTKFVQIIEDGMDGIVNQGLMAIVAIPVTPIVNAAEQVTGYTGTMQWLDLSTGQEGTPVPINQ